MTEEHDRIDAEIARVAKSSDPFAAAVRTTRMPMIITDPSKPDNPIVFVNEAFCRLSGYTRAEIVGQNCRFLQGAQTSRSDIARIRDAVARRVPVEIELLNHKKSGEVFWNRLLISPVFDEAGRLTYFFASQFDVTLERDRLVRLQRDRDALEVEVARRTRDLTQGEEHLRFILKAGRLGSWTLDLRDQRLLASDICKENFGRPPGDPFTYQDLLQSIEPDDRSRMEEAVQRSIKQQSDYEIEYRVRTPSGELRWLQIRGQVYYKVDGTPLTMAGVSIDITERKRSEEHRNLLTAELNHRVKNSMATLQSIARQTLRNAASLEDAEGLLESRIVSLASAHDVLTRENWDGASLLDVVKGAIEPFDIGATGRFRIGGPRLRLSPSKALAVSLAIHEMATNAVKYGALSNDRGTVLVNWDVEANGDARRFKMRWEEIDGPLVSEPKRRGFGTRIVERNLASELNGDAELDFRPLGVVLDVSAPLSYSTANDMFNI